MSIPFGKAAFIDDVAQYMRGKLVDQVIYELQQLANNYKMLEAQAAQKRQRLLGKLPEIQRALQVVDMLLAKQDSQETLVADFELADGVFATGSMQVGRGRATPGLPRGRPPLSGAARRGGCMAAHAAAGPPHTALQLLRRSELMEPSFCQVTCQHAAPLCIVRSWHCACNAHACRFMVRVARLQSMRILDHFPKPQPQSTTRTVLHQSSFCSPAHAGGETPRCRGQANTHCPFHHLPFTPPATVHAHRMCRA